MLEAMESSKPVGRRLEESLRDFWATRPERPLVGRRFAGVAAALGNRYSIDPTLIRVVFVTCTVFGGSGLVCYLLGWLLLRKQGDRASAFGSMVGRGTSSVSSLFTVLLCLALIPASGVMLGGNFLLGGPLGGPIGFAGLLVALYLLHGSRAQLAVAPQPVGRAEETAARRGTATAPVTDPASWDAFGAAPFAWDLPEPARAPQQAPPPPRKPRKSKKVGLIGLLVTLLAIAGCVLFAAATDGWMTPAHAAAIVLAAVGTTMILGSFAGGGRGLIVLAVLFAAGSLLAMRADLGGTQNERFTPARTDQVQAEYRNDLGSLHLDLTRLPESGTVHTSVTTRLGAATVIVPRTADVTVNCETRLGKLDCLGTKSSGTGPSPVSKVDNGTNGKGGLVIDLDANTDLGTVEVRRG